MEYLDTISKDPVTVLYKFDIDTTPGHLQNSTGKLAIRVSTHYHLKTLFERFNNPIIESIFNTVVSFKKNCVRPISDERSCPVRFLSSARCFAYSFGVTPLIPRSPFFTK